MVNAVNAALVIAIILTSTVIVLNAIPPIMQEGRSSQAFVGAINTLTGVDSVIDQVLVEAPGAKRSIDVSVGKGSFVVNEERNRIFVALREHAPVDPGDVDLGNIRVESGTYVKGYEADIDGDGNYEYVLENSALIFTVKKLGSPIQNVTVNTSSIIPVIHNKRSGINITPVASIQIDESPETANGLGYTQLTKGGSLINEAEILLFLNTTSGIKYNTFFRLRPDDDYVQVKIANITLE